MASHEERMDVAERLRSTASDWRQFSKTNPYVSLVVDVGELPAMVQDLLHDCGIDGMVETTGVFDRLADLVEPSEDVRELMPEEER